MNIFQKVMLLFKVKGFIETDIKEAQAMDSTGIKPGWQTTEFWGKLAVQAATLWGAIQGFVPPKWAAIIAVSGEAVYTIARTVLKAIQVIQQAKSGQTTVTTTQPATVVTTPA